MTSAFLALGALLAAAQAGSTPAPVSEAAPLPQRAAPASGALPSLDALLAHRVRLRPELEGVHPRVFVTAKGLEELKARAKGSHAAEWSRALASLRVRRGPPPPPPGPQARRAQNEAAFAIAESAFAYKIEGDPKLLESAKSWLLAAIDYEPWGYTYNKPNVDLAAGHLLYAIGWAYDLLHADLSGEERTRVRRSLERHANLVAEHFTPKPGGKFAYTQNHDYIPTAGLAVTALALFGESPDAPRWAALARAHQHRAMTMLSPDGYYYEGFEYWIFSAPWLVHFLDAWEHATGESLWALGPFRNWKLYVAHSLLPNGQDVFDFGDIWEGSLTRSRQGEDYKRAYPGGALQSNFNLLYRVAARLRDPEAQAVAERLRAAGHSNLEETWTLLWRDPKLAPAPIAKLPLRHHFTDSGVVMARSSWDANATAFAFKAGPPQGHRVAKRLAQLPDARLDSGHAHPDGGSFIIFANGKYLVGDTGYSGSSSAKQHNTLTVDGHGQGREGSHDLWDDLPYERLNQSRIVNAQLGANRVVIRAELAGLYPPEARLRRFTRTFTFRAPETFTVVDDVEAEADASFVWRLHADQPYDLTGDRFTTPAAAVAGPRLEGRVLQPKDARIATAKTLLLAPGKPGSIEKGQTVERAHSIELSPPNPTKRARFEVVLRAVTGGAAAAGGATGEAAAAKGTAR